MGLPPGIYMLLALPALAPVAHAACAATLCVDADCDGDGFETWPVDEDCDDCDDTVHPAASEDGIDWIDHDCDDSPLTRRA